MNFLKGTRLPHRKGTADRPTARLTEVREVTLPVQMHIGAPAVPVVKVGDSVKVGTLIAEPSGRVSSPVYASVSGKVKKIADIVLSNGKTAPAITIESDGMMTRDESAVPPAVTDRKTLIEAVRDSGVVGLGGAGFPTHVKFDVDPARVDSLIINGAECEPYITSDTQTMVERSEDMAYALKTLQAHFDFQRIVIGVEGMNRRAIRSMQEMASHMERVEVKVLPNVYPQGGEKVLVYHTTGRTIPMGKLPVDVGCIVCNCTTLAAIGNYLRTGMPLVEKCITVDGGAVASPQNVIVPIGTAMADVFEFCGGLTQEPDKVLYGGPMMGVTVPNLSAPVLKNTNAALALTAKETRLPKTTACIRCGACANACPFGLTPAAIAQAYRKKDAARLEELSVRTCMECGCCSFVCPANRPLVQTNKLAKIFLQEEKAKEEQKHE